MMPNSMFLRRRPAGPCPCQALSRPAGSIDKPFDDCRHFIGHFQHGKVAMRRDALSLFRLTVFIPAIFHGARFPRAFSAPPRKPKRFGPSMPLRLPNTGPTGIPASCRTAAALLAYRPSRSFSAYRFVSACFPCPGKTPLAAPPAEPWADVVILVFRFKDRQAERTFSERMQGVFECAGQDPAQDGDGQEPGWVQPQNLYPPSGLPPSQLSGAGVFIAAKISYFQKRCGLSLQAQRPP